MVIRPYNADHIKPLTQRNKDLTTGQVELDDDNAYGAIETREVSNQQKIAIRDTHREWNQFRQIRGNITRYVYPQFKPVNVPKTKSLFQNTITELRELTRSKDVEMKDLITDTNDYPNSSRLKPSTKRRRGNEKDIPYQPPRKRIRRVRFRLPESNIILYPTLLPRKGP